MSMMGLDARNINSAWPVLMSLIVLGSKMARWRVDSETVRPPPAWRVVVFSGVSRSPINCVRSLRSLALLDPPRMILEVAESQMAWAWSLPHRSRAWAKDCNTATVVMPEPPPSLINAPKEGSG